MREGARVVCVDIDEAKTAALEGRARDAGPGSLAVERLDLADTRGLARGLEAVLARAPRFGALINNPALHPPQPFEDFSLHGSHGAQRVNVEAGVVCVRADLPGLREGGWCRIVNIASVTFYGGWAYLYPYVASKAALVGLTRAW